MVKWLLSDEPVRSISYDNNNNNNKRSHNTGTPCTLPQCKASQIASYVTKTKQKTTTLFNIYLSSAPTHSCNNENSPHLMKRKRYLKL